MEEKLFAVVACYRAIYECDSIDEVLFAPCVGAVLNVVRIVHIISYRWWIACFTGVYNTIRINLFIGTLLYFTLRFYTLLYYGVIGVVSPRKLRDK